MLFLGDLTDEEIAKRASRGTRVLFNLKNPKSLLFLTRLKLFNLNPAIINYRICIYVGKILVYLTLEFLSVWHLA